MKQAFGFGFVAISLLGLLALPFATKYNKSLRGFFLMNRELKSMPYYIAAILAANLSIGNFLIFASIWGFRFGWSGFLWFEANLALNCLVYIVFIPDFYPYIKNKKNSGTVHEFLADTFGHDDLWKRRIRLLASVTTILGLLLAIVFELHIAASVLALYLQAEADLPTLFLALTVLICLYSSRGGFFSMIFTDHVGAAAMIAGVVAVAFVIVQSPHAHEIIAKIPSPFSIKLLGIGPSNLISILSLGGGWLLVSMDQWQRTCALKKPEPNELRKDILLYGAIASIFALGFSLIGMIDRGFIGFKGANPLSDFLAARDLFAVGSAWSWLFVVFALALICAAMSTANTFLLVCGHSFSSDIARSDPEGAALEKGRGTIIGMGAFIIASWLFLDLSGLFREPIRFFFIAYSVQFALLAPIVSLKLPSRWRQPHGAAVFCSVLVGVIASLVFGFACSGDFCATDHIALTPLFTWLFGTVTLFLVNLIPLKREA